MTKPKYRRLTYDDRRVIENMCKAKKTQSEIANAIGVSQFTISRELSRNRVESVYANVFAIIAHQFAVLTAKNALRFLLDEKQCFVALHA